MLIGNFCGIDKKVGGYAGLWNFARVPLTSDWKLSEKSSAKTGEKNIKNDDADGFKRFTHAGLAVSSEDRVKNAFRPVLMIELPRRT